MKLKLSKKNTPLRKGWTTNKEFPNSFYKVYKKDYGIMIYIDDPIEKDTLWSASIWHLPSCNQIKYDEFPDFLSALEFVRIYFDDKRI